MRGQPTLQARSMRRQCNGPIQAQRLWPELRHAGVLAGSQTGDPGGSHQGRLSFTLLRIEKSARPASLFAARRAFFRPIFLSCGINIKSLPDYHRYQRFHHRHHLHHCTEEYMNFIIWIVIGGVIGWLASMVMQTDAQQGIFLNIVVGIVGAFLGGWLLAPLFGTGTINSDNFSLSSLLVSFLGAVILLGIVNLLRRGKLR